MCKQNVAKGVGLESKVNVFNYVLNCGGAVKTLMQLKPLEAMGNCLEIFVIFWKKQLFLCHLGHILHIFRAICINYIFNISMPIGKLKLFSPPFTYNSRFKPSVFGHSEDFSWRSLFCHENNQF